MKRILVIGATGFTGERVVRRLLLRGYHVLALVREEESTTAAALARAGALIRTGDCLRRWTLWEALDGCDALISCVHTQFAEACVQACRVVGVSRIIVMSSTRRFTRFTDPGSQRVIEGEGAVAMSSLDWTILRSTMIYGSERDRNVSLLLNWFKKRPILFLLGRGTSLVQPVYVEDVVEAIVNSVDTEESIGHALNLAGPEPITWRRFLTEIARAAGVKNPRLPSVPLGLGLAAASFAGPILERYGITTEMIQRLSEDKHVGIQASRDILNFRPMQFQQALRLQVEGKTEVEVLYPETAEASVS